MTTIQERLSATVRDIQATAKAVQEANKAVNEKILDNMPQMIENAERVEKLMKQR